MNREFDVKQIAENIYILADKKGIKLGAIESNAGVSTGYLSRMKKDGSGMSPSGEVLSGIADQLEVSLDILVNGKLNQMSSDEVMMLDFVHRLAEETRQGAIDWKRESQVLLSKLEQNEHNSVAHELFSIGDTVQFDPLHGEPFRCMGPVYNSSFVESNLIWINGDCYNARLKHTDARVYLMKTQQNDDGVNQDGYEMYLINHLELPVFQDGPDTQYYVETDVKPLCNTVMVRDEIRIAIETLYSLIQSEKAQLGIDEAVKGIIGEYMNGDNSNESNDGDVPF